MALDAKVRVLPTEPVAEGASSAPGRLLVTVEEAAEMLAIGRTKAYEMVRSGELPTMRIGRVVRIPLEALREWIQRESGGEGRA